MKSDFKDSDSNISSQRLFHYTITCTKFKKTDHTKLEYAIKYLCEIYKENDIYSNTYLIRALTDTEGRMWK